MPPSHGHRCLCLLLTCSRSLFRRLRLPKLFSLQPRLRVSLCLPPVSLVVLRFARLAHCRHVWLRRLRPQSLFLPASCLWTFLRGLGPSVCCPCRPWREPVSNRWTSSASAPHPALPSQGSDFVRVVRCPSAHLSFRLAYPSRLRRKLKSCGSLVSSTSAQGTFCP